MTCFSCLHSGMDEQDRFVLACRMNADHYLNDDLSLKRCPHHTIGLQQQNNKEDENTTPASSPAESCSTPDSTITTSSASSSASTTPNKHHPNRPDMRRLNACVSKFHRLHAHAETGKADR